MLHSYKRFPEFSKLLITTVNETQLLLVEKCQTSYTSQVYTASQNNIFLSQKSSQMQAPAAGFQTVSSIKSASKEVNE
jgi:hypothetical protein